MLLLPLRYKLQRKSQEETFAGNVGSAQDQCPDTRNTSLTVQNQGFQIQVSYLLNSYLVDQSKLSRNFLLIWRSLSLS
jgi:hypothetical protein